ncbi:peptidoglycan DD-metalloendopeptidase family protein [Streptomyces subrutilus]|uniref:peptidoglycan DD-metalloendopeptidase family protein n=1 Tax=Streptomyces subrutilus TaxID=36818 RepID=UPI000D1A0963
MTTLLLSLLMALVQAAVPGVRPLPGPLSVARWWDPPPTPYAAGHRGVDLSAPVGAEVRAVGPGRVHYAGEVAGRGVLSLTLPNGLRTTYEPVRALVSEGEAVTAGQVVAVLTRGSHCQAPCLHWGLLSGEVYLNPLALLPRPTPRLLPDPGPAGPPGARAPGRSWARGPQPPTPRRAMATAASVTTSGSSAAPSSIRRTAASTTP